MSVSRENQKKIKILFVKMKLLHKILNNFDIDNLCFEILFYGFKKSFQHFLIKNFSPDPLFIYCYNYKLN